MAVKQFDISIKNKPGELANVTEVLANHAVNIRAIASEASSERPIVRIITNDEKTTRNALKKAEFSFKERDVLTISVLDRPGELAKITKRLARKKVNIESIFVLEKYDGRVEFAIGVDDTDTALKVLNKEEV